MKIIICGGGALGSHALFIGRDLGHELAVVDFDRVETKNLASQWFVKQMVGKNKATALKMQLFNFYGIRLQDYPVRLTELNVETILSEYDLIVDCFDNAASRRLVQGFAREHDVSCLHAGLAAGGAFGSVRWDRHFAIDDEDVPGQATCDGGGFLPIILRMGSALATSMREYLAGGTELNWNVSPAHAESFTA